MTIYVFLGLTLLAWIANTLKRRRTASCLLVANLVIMIAGASGWIPSLLLQHVQVPSRLADVEWAEHNSIVMLGNGTLSRVVAADQRIPIFGYSRVVATALAYTQCRNRHQDCKVIASGGDPLHHGLPEAKAYSQVLSSIGVPESDIISESYSRNTWENAANSTKLIPQDHKIVVIASGYQLRKAILYFSFFRPGVVGVAADMLDAEDQTAFASLNLVFIDLAIHEQIGIWRHRIYNALGWNSKPTDQIGEQKTR